LIYKTILASLVLVFLCAVPAYGSRSCYTLEQQKHYLKGWGYVLHKTIEKDGIVTSVLKQIPFKRFRIIYSDKRGCYLSQEDGSYIVLKSGGNKHENITLGY